MIGRTHSAGGRTWSLVVWLVLVAFCVTVFSSSVFALNHPWGYSAEKSKPTTDDTHWGDTNQAGKQGNQPRLLTTHSWLWLYNIIFPWLNHQNTLDGNRDTQTNDLTQPDPSRGTATE